MHALIHGFSASHSQHDGFANTYDSPPFGACGSASRSGSVNKETILSLQFASKAASRSLRQRPGPLKGWSCGMGPPANRSSHRPKAGIGDQRNVLSTEYEAPISLS